MSEVRLITGTQRSARSALIDAQFEAHWGRAMLVLPSRAAATARRDALLRKARRGLWGNPICDFKDFATALLAQDGHEVRTLGDAERRLLIQASVEAALVDPAAYGVSLASDSPGLARHLLHIIGQLKQAAIEPAQFEARLSEAGALSPMDRLVAAVYGRYQDALKAGAAYDVPGLYWAAEAHCLATRPTALAGIEVILLDGFDDFTPSEFRLLEALRSHVPQLYFGVNYDDAPSRQDCFRTSARTVQIIADRFQVRPRACAAEPAATLTEYVADNLFWRDPPPSPEGLDINLHVLTCPDLATEMETLARSAKRCLLDGDTTDDIAVVLPDLAEAAAALRGAFAAAGVPLRMREQRSLAESPAGGLVQRLARAWQRWAHDAVLDVLASPRLPWPGAHREAYPYLARKALVIEGFREWQVGMASLQRRVAERRGEDVLALCKRLPQAAAALVELQATLEAMNAFAAGLPAQGTPDAHAAAWERIVDAMAAAGGDDAGWPAVRAVLALLRRITAPAPWTREVFEQQFLQALRETPYASAAPTQGVLACKPDELRNRQFKRVFLGGLVEGVMPRQPGINAIYSDSGRTRLAQAGIPLEGARERLDKERMVFHHAIAAATGSLTLSWRLLKADQREASPSPFLADVQALLAPVPGLSTAVPFSESLAPPAGHVLSKRDFRHRAILEGGAWRTALDERAPQVGQAAALELQRQSPAAWDAHDGALAAPDVLAALSANYGPDCAFSVRRLETYRECPFRFFQDHVLQVETAETPEAEFDPRVRGIILHDVLEAFHRHFLGLSVSEIPEDEADARMREILDEVFDAKGWRSVAAPPSVRAAEHAYLRDLLLRYLVILRTDEDRWKPTHFEVAFGARHDAAITPPSTVETFTLETAAGPVQFAGRIDRIDRDEHSVRIVDYKTRSTPAPGAILTGLSLQCTVYAWAVEQLLLPGTKCAKGVYIPVGRRVGQQPWREALHPEKPRDADQWAAREDTAREAIALAVQGMRTGQFSPVRGGKTCYGCGDVRACRHDAARVARKLGIAEGDTEDDV